MSQTQAKGKQRGRKENEGKGLRERERETEWVTEMRRVKGQRERELNKIIKDKKF